MTESWVPVSTRVCALAGVFACCATLEADEASAPDALAQAPANTWVKIHEAKTGAREQPIFVWASKAGKIVLFGGDGLDRALSDTWVYDCKARTWEQRFPDRSPAPRAGHILGWLPRAKKIVLAGGYSVPQEFWTYDVAANEWTALQSVPNTGKGSPNTPNVGPREYQIGAVADGDVLVCMEKSTVWACKVEPGQPAAGAEKAAATPVAGRYAWKTFSPAMWEREAEKAGQTDPAKGRKFLDELPVNQWTTFSFPRYAPGSNNRWGTTAYDTDRHQFLFWGGGHSTSHENDVAHFSVRAGFWTVGYYPDDPIEYVYWPDFKWVENGKPVGVPDLNREFQDAMAYDPKLKLCLINHSQARKVWAMKCDRETANLVEVKESSTEGAAR